MVEDFDIKDKVSNVTADGAANVKKAVLDAGFQYLHCFGHAIDLVVKEAIKLTPACTDVREKVSAIVGFTRRSTQAKEKFAKCQVTSGLAASQKETLKLIQGPML